jgi:light-regulated signal transduction histidine kinase (bacteriophytochrome)
MEDRENPEGRAFTPPSSATLARCDDEPIHIPGAVQPHGCLFETQGADFTIRCVSSNIRAVLGMGAGDALGRPIAEVLGESARTG